LKEELAQEFGLNFDKGIMSHILVIFPRLEKYFIEVGGPQLSNDRLEGSARCKNEILSEKLLEI